MGYRLVHYYPHALTVETGPNAAIWGWASAIAGLGISVRMLHTGGTGCRSDVIRCVPIGRLGRKDRFIPWGLRHLLGSGDILILHSGYVLHNLAAALVASRMHIPFVVVPHGAYAAAIRRRRRLVRSVWEILERRLLRAALAVHVFSDAEEQDVRRLAPRVRCIEAPIGVDLPEQRWLGGGGYIAWVGRYDVHIKGLDWLINAVQALPEAERPLIRLRGVDDKQSRIEVERMVGRKGVAQWVRAEGPVYGDDKVEFLVAAEAYIHPSRAEAQSLALMEAISLGIPTVVSTSVNSAPVLDKARAAILVDVNEVNALGDALRLLADRRADLSRSARNVIASEYSWGLVAERFIDQLDAIFPGR